MELLLEKSTIMTTAEERKARNNERHRAWAEKWRQTEGYKLAKERARERQRARRHTEEFKLKEKAWRQTEKGKLKQVIGLSRANAKLYGHAPVIPETITPIPLDNRCQICGQPASKLVCDHDHVTGVFRGWVCYTCNSRLRYYDARVKKNAQQVKDKNPGLAQE